MTSTLFRRAVYGLIGLALAFIFIGNNMSGGSTNASLSPLPAATPTPVPTPSKVVYNCGDVEAPDYLQLKWTERRPNGGWVGTATYGTFVNKPVQAFDVKVVPGYGLNWAFQAQDGSFLCRMYVSNLPGQKFVSFEQCRNNVWPQLSCFRPRLTVDTMP